MSVLGDGFVNYFSYAVSLKPLMYELLRVSHGVGVKILYKETGIVNSVCQLHFVFNVNPHAAEHFSRTSV